MLGLAGAHRVGKSTLAKAYAEKHGWKFAPTTISSIIRSLGHEPNEDFDFKTRLTIQQQVLLRMNEFYGENQGNSVITDRTPLDFLAYTTAEAIGDKVLPEDQVRFKRYVEDCFLVTNRWFGGLLVVQPGIPLVAEDGKAALNEAYMEHLNMIIIGMCSDTRLKVPHFYVPRQTLDIEARMKSVDYVIRRGQEKVLIETQGLEKSAFH